MDKIKSRIEGLPEEPTQPEMPYKLVGNYPRCIFRSQDVSPNEVDGFFPKYTLGVGWRIKRKILRLFDPPHTKEATQPEVADELMEKYPR